MAKTKKPAVQAEEPKCYVYLGPSIRGVIQTGTIYTGTLAEICERLTTAISEFPKIKMLLIEANEVADIKNKINNGVNLYSLAYKALAE